MSSHKNGLGKIDFQIPIEEETSLEVQMQEELLESELKNSPKLRKFISEAVKCKNKETYCNLPSLVYAYSVAKHSYGLAKKYFLELLNDQEISGLFKRNRLKAKFTAYLFSILIRNCHGTNFQAAEGILGHFGQFNNEEELLCSAWLVPLSGSLYDDLRINFVAKAAKNKPFEELLPITDEMLAVIVEQIASTALYGFSQYAEVPYLLQMCLKKNDGKATEMRNCILSMFDESQSDAAHSISQHEKNCRKSFDVNAFLSTISLDTDGSPLPNTGIFSKINRSGECGSYWGPTAGIDTPVDTRMVAPDKAMPGITLTPHLYFDDSDDDFASDLFRHYWEQERRDPGFAEEIPEANRSFIMFEDRLKEFTSFASAADRERTEYFAIKQELIQRNKKKKKADRQQKKQSATEKPDNQEILDALKREQANQQEKVAALTKQCRDQQSEIHHLQNKRKALEDKLEECESINREQKFQIDALEQEAEALSSQLEEPAAAPAASAPLDTSPLDQVKIVCYGGHPTWAAALKAFHENVRLYPNGGPMPEEAMDVADMVWLQVNSLSHKAFYRLINHARFIGKPVKYFAFAGHETSKRQLIQETQRFLAAKESNI